MLSLHLGSCGLDGGVAVFLDLVDDEPDHQDYQQAAQQSTDHCARDHPVLRLCGRTTVSREQKNQ